MATKRCVAKHIFGEELLNHYHCWIGNDWKGPLSWEKLLQLCRDGVIIESTPISLNNGEAKPAQQMFGENWSKMRPSLHSSKPAQPVPPPVQPSPTYHPPQPVGAQQHPIEAVAAYSQPSPHGPGNNQTVNVTTQVVHTSGGSGAALLIAAILCWLVAAGLLLFAFFGLIGALGNARNPDVGSTILCFLFGFCLPGVVFLATGFVCFHFARKQSGSTTVFRA